jgi:hypothetical protein
MVLRRAEAPYRHTHTPSRVGARDGARPRRRYARPRDDVGASLDLRVRWLRPRSAVDVVTQATRLYAFLVTHPGASSLEIQQALVITNATGRISDLRRKGETDGFTVIGVKRPDGHMGFHIRPTGELTLGLAS